MPKSHYWLYLLYILIWIAAAINPKYPEDWLLENILPILFFPLVIWLDRHLGFSFGSLLLLLLFGTLHAIGSHYTYAEVPFFEPLRDLFGFERNHTTGLSIFSSGCCSFVRSLRSLPALSPVRDLRYLSRLR